MNLHLGKTLTQLAEQLLEPVNGQSRVQAPLHQQLGAVMVDQFLDLGKDGVSIKQIGVGIASITVKSAETALRIANIGVIDIAINNEGYAVVGMFVFANQVGQLADFQQISLGQQL